MKSSLRAAIVTQVVSTTLLLLALTSCHKMVARYSGSSPTRGPLRRCLETQQGQNSAPPLFRSNSPADELITIAREGDAYVLTFIPHADKSYEKDRVVIGDAKKLWSWGGSGQ